MSADRAARRIVVHDHPIKVFAGHPRAFALIGGYAVLRTRTKLPSRGSTPMSADRPVRRIVVHDPLKSPTQKHEEPYLIRVDSVRSAVSVFWLLLI